MNTLVPIASGSEEIEAVIIIDTLRRAGFNVTVAGLTDGAIQASRGVRLLPDTGWNAIHPDAFELLLLPGGFGGTMAFCQHTGLQQALKDFYAAGKWIGAICAAPLALHAAGVLEGRRFTCYPGVEENLPPAVQPVQEPVVVDGRLITSQGPGTAFEFALRISAECGSPDLSTEVRTGLLC